MAAKTRRSAPGVPGSPGNQIAINQENKTSEVTIAEAKIKLADMERKLTVAESDLSRSQTELIDTFKVNTVDEALAMVNKWNEALPGLKIQKDQQVVIIQEFLAKMG